MNSKKKVRGEERARDRHIARCPLDIKRRGAGRRSRCGGARRCGGAAIPRVITSRSSRLAIVADATGLFVNTALRKMDVYDSRERDWKNLDVSREELHNITECLKKEEFRKLLIEYAEEVTDPDNRKIYEKEIAQLEKERGVDVTFVNPEPGYVIKTSVNGERKCFLNISKSDIVARPTSQPSYEQGHRGLQWSIPYTLIPPRDDLDKRNARCTVFDVVFHPDTIYLASKNTRFRDVVNNTAMDGVESSFKVVTCAESLGSTFFLLF